MREYSATQGTETSRVFQTRPSRPSGPVIRSISVSAAGPSNQCQACAATTASTEPSGSPVASATPATLIYAATGSDGNQHLYGLDLANPSGSATAPVRRASHIEPGTTAMQTALATRNGGSAVSQGDPEVTAAITRWMDLDTAAGSDGRGPGCSR